MSGTYILLSYWSTEWYPFCSCAAYHAVFGYNQNFLYKGKILSQQTLRHLPWCRFNFGMTSQTSGQHQNYIGSMSCFSLVTLQLIGEFFWCNISISVIIIYQYLWSYNTEKCASEEINLFALHFSVFVQMSRVSVWLCHSRSHYDFTKATNACHCPA